MKLATWGTNFHYESGTGEKGPPNTVPVEATLVPDVVEVACAYHFVVLRTPTGRVLTFGGNVNGELGDGTHEMKGTPVDIGLTDVVKIGAGGAHAVALDVYGIPHLWGIGPIGDGRPGGEGYGTPVPVSLPYHFRDLVTGGPNCYGIDQEGDVYGWGWNGKGQLGDGTQINKVFPTLLSVKAKEVACGGSSPITAHTLFLTPGGEVLACGANIVGQSGQTPTPVILTPTLIEGLSDVVKVAASYSTSYAITSDGTLYGWGRLPDGTGSSAPVPLLDGVTDVAAGTEFFLAISEGVLVGAGNNNSGQLGDGTREDKPGTVLVQGLNNVVQVDTGEADGHAHVAALQIGGRDG